MALYMNVEDAFGNSIGDGPITTISFLRITDRMDRDGEWYAEMPASDPRAALVVVKRIAELYILDERGKTTLGKGEIEARSVIRNENLPPVLTIRGSGRLRELILTTIPFGTSYTESNIIPADLINKFASVDLLPDAWLLSGQGETNRALTMQIYGDNVLEALISITEVTGEHFRRGSRDREIVWIGNVQDLEETGITATTYNYEGRQPNLCRILSITDTIDAWELFNGIYAYGATEDDAAPITMNNADTWPDGAPIQESERISVTDEDGNTTLTNTYRHNLGGTFWTLDKDNNLLVNTTSRDAQQYGPRTKTLTFNELSPPEGATQVQNSNMVLQAAWNWLRTRVEPAVFLEMVLADLEVPLLPGQKMRTVARWERDGEIPAEIDSDVYILEVVSEVDERGRETTGVIASTVDRWMITEDDIVLGGSFGSNTSAASIVGVGHTHDGRYASVLHTHDVDGRDHTHNELKADGSVRLAGDLLPDSIERRRLGRVNDRFAEVWSRDMSAVLVRGYLASRGLSLTDESNNRGILIKNGRVYVGPDINPSRIPNAMCEVNGDLGLVQVQFPPGAFAGMVKIAALQDGRLVAIFPDGTLREFAFV